MISGLSKYAICTTSSRLNAEVPKPKSFRVDVHQDATLSDMARCISLRTHMTQQQTEMMMQLANAAAALGREKAINRVANDFDIPRVSLVDEILKLSL